MSDLHLSSGDLVALAAALVPLIVPSVRSDLAAIAQEVARQVKDLDGSGTDDGIAVALAHVQRIRNEDERAFSAIKPIEIGTVVE